MLHIICLCWEKKKPNPVTTLPRLMKLSFSIPEEVKGRAAGKSRHQMGGMLGWLARNGGGNHRNREKERGPNGHKVTAGYCATFFFNFSFFLFLRLFLSCIDYPTTNDSGCYCINRVQNGRCDFLSSFCRQSESRETVSFFSLVLVVEIDLLLQQNNNNKKKES